MVWSKEPHCLSSSDKETAPPSPWPTTAAPSAATLLAFPLRVLPLRDHHPDTPQLSSPLLEVSSTNSPRPCSALRRVGSIEDPKPPGEKKKSCGFILGSSHSCRRARWHCCFRNYNNIPQNHGMLCPLTIQGSPTQDADLERAHTESKRFYHGLQTWNLVLMS